LPGNGTTAARSCFSSALIGKQHNRPVARQELSGRRKGTTNRRWPGTVRAWAGGGRRRCRATTAVVDSLLKHAFEDLAQTIEFTNPTRKEKNHTPHPSHVFKNHNSIDPSRSISSGCAHPHLLNRSTNFKAAAFLNIPQGSSESTSAEKSNDFRLPGLTACAA